MNSTCRCWHIDITYYPSYVFYQQSHDKACYLTNHITLIYIYLRYINTYMQSYTLKCYNQHISTRSLLYMKQPSYLLMHVHTYHSIIILFIYNIDSYFLHNYLLYSRFHVLHTYQYVNSYHINITQSLWYHHQIYHVARYYIKQITRTYIWYIIIYTYSIVQQ